MVPARCIHHDYGVRRIFCIRNIPCCLHKGSGTYLGSNGNQRCRIHRYNTIRTIDCGSAFKYFPIHARDAEKMSETDPAPSRPGHEIYICHDWIRHGGPFSLFHSRPADHKHTCHGNPAQRACRTYGIHGIALVSCRLLRIYACNLDNTRTFMESTYCMDIYIRSDPTDIFPRSSTCRLREVPAVAGLVRHTFRIAGMAFRNTLQGGQTGLTNFVEHRNTIRL